MMLITMNERGKTMRNPYTTRMRNPYTTQWSDMMDDGFDYYLYENKPPETLRERVWCWLYARREQIVKLYRKVRPYRIHDLEHEASLRDWRRENPLPEPVDDGLPW
jgi:hypothetical protein